LLVEEGVEVREKGFVEADVFGGEVLLLDDSLCETGYV
jgi:hypothetical protein